jgi:tyrosine-protein phosphatase SIW14
VARIDLGADGAIDTRAIQRALRLVMDPALWPVLLHCDGGRHRTGIVTAALRRSQGFSLDQALDEYERLAAPTPRVADCAAIARYYAEQERAEAGA